MINPFNWSVFWVVHDVKTSLPTRPVIVKIIIGSRTVGTTGDVGAGVVVVVKV
jgi:hypothetical protein